MGGCAAAHTWLRRGGTCGHCGKGCGRDTAKLVLVCCSRPARTSPPRPGVAGATRTRTRHAPCHARLWRRSAPLRHGDAVRQCGTVRCVAVQCGAFLCGPLTIEARANCGGTAVYYCSFSYHNTRTAKIGSLCQATKLFDKNPFMNSSNKKN